VWHNNFTLWKATVQENPYSWPAHSNFGYALYDDGRYVEAVQHWQQAARLGSTSADTYVGMAIGLEAMGQPLAAEQAFAHGREMDAHYRSIEALREYGAWTSEQLVKLQPIADRYFAKHPQSQPATQTSQPAAGN
jgi:tetratricopeptide (TPR) repeat protein